MSAQRQYELVYIVQPEAAEAEVDAFQKLIAGVVERFSGTIDRTENWGRRRLAYEIKHHRDGIYVLDVITGPADMMKEVERRLRVTDGIIRHLVVRVDEDLRIAEQSRARRQAETRRRRVARGLPPEPEPGEARPGRRDDGDDQEGEA
ncbi:MAG: 30S ribosomal protein S6 [Vicinamibacterales bacterium]